MDSSGDPPVVKRDVVRLVVLDVRDRILLLRVRDPLRPELGTCWELPGGGIEPGETYAAAAVRELREETGIVVRPADIAPPTWRRRVTFLHAGRRRLQDERVALARMAVPGPPVDGAGRLGDEKAAYCGHRWWPIRAVETSAERFYPSRLPALLGPFLAGERIDEPFERFS